jgi:hypothetical protein
MLVRNVLGTTKTLFERLKATFASGMRSNNHLVTLFRGLHEQAAAKRLDKLLKYNKINQPATAETLQPYVDFLAENWEILKLSNEPHPYQLDFPFTNCCLSLATDLANTPFFPVHRFKLLMPTLNTYHDVMDADIKDLDADLPQKERLKLRDFVLSDDRQRMIYIKESLDFSEEDGLLKHTNVLTAELSQIVVDDAAIVMHASSRKLIPLSEKERARVITSSLPASQYFSALSDLQKAKTNSNSIGAAVLRLATELEYGGKDGNRGGTDILAGDDAMAGIAAFYEYTTYLTADEKKQLYEISQTNNSHEIFRFWWFYLLLKLRDKYLYDFGISPLLPEDELVLDTHFLQPIFTALDDKNKPKVNLTDPMYNCCQYIGRRIKEILNANSQLYTTFPANQQDTKKIIIGSVRKTVLRARTRFEHALQENNLRLLKRGAENDDENIMLKTIFNKHIFSFKDLTNALIRVYEFSQKEKLIVQIVESPQLRAFIPTTAELMDIMNVSHDALLLAVLNQLGSPHLKSLIDSKNKLKLILSKLPNNLLSKFLNNYIGEAHWVALGANTNDFVLSSGCTREARKTLYTVFKISNEYRLFHQKRNLQDEEEPTKSQGKRIRL